MKQQSLVVLLAFLFAFSICTASCNKDDETSPIQNNSDNNPSKSNMKITIGTAIFTATLYDNPSTNALKAMFPLTINMTELNNNEKYFDFPNNFPNNASIGGDIKVGDLTLYGNNTLVLFYKSFNTSYNYTKLGYINDPTELATALGNRNVIVKFENN